jgi:hypothetical protein
VLAGAAFDVSARPVRGRSSFLKKSSKRPLYFGADVGRATDIMSKKFFGSFFQKRTRFLPLVPTRVAVANTPVWPVLAARRNAISAKGLGVFFEERTAGFPCAIVFIQLAFRYASGRQ